MNFTIKLSYYHRWHINDCLIILVKMKSNYHHDIIANEFASRILMPKKFIERLLQEKKIKLSDVITVNKEDRRDKKVINANIVERMADSLWVSEPALIVRLCRKDLDDLRGEEGFYAPEKITK